MQFTTKKIYNNENILCNFSLVWGKDDERVADDSGHTALHLAAEIGSANLTDLLITKGAVIDQLDNNLKSALQLATENGNS